MSRPKPPAGGVLPDPAKASETEPEKIEPNLAQAWIDIYVIDEPPSLPPLAEIIAELMSLEAPAANCPPVAGKWRGGKRHSRDARAEKQVLAVLRAAQRDNPGQPYLSFALIRERTGLDEKLLRRSARHLRHDGLVQYGRGSHWVDGVNVGSGYAVTDKGRAAPRSVRRKQKK